MVTPALQRFHGEHWGAGMNRPHVIRVVIAGRHFESLHQAHVFARRKGFAGGETCLAGRIKRGMTTWAELLAPLNAVAVRNAARMSGSNAAKKEAWRLELLAMRAGMELRRVGVVG